MRKLLILLSLLTGIGILLGCTKDSGGSANNEGSLSNTDKIVINENEQLNKIVVK